MVKKLFKALKIILVSLALGLSFSCQNQVQMNPKMHGGFSYAGSHSITYMNVNGLQNDNPKNFDDLESVELLPVEKDGYGFDGWYTTSNFRADSKITGWGAFEKDSDLVLYAKFVQERFTISYRNVGGLNNPNQTTYNIKDKVELKPVEKDGFAFEGWYTSSNFASGTKISGWEPYEKNTTVTLYAKFVQERFNITYYNISGITNPNPSTFDIKNDFNLQPVRKNGYVFEGWYTTSSFTESSKITGWKAFEKTSNVSIYAKFIEITLTLDKRVVIFKGTGEAPVTVTSTIVGIEDPTLVWSSSNESVAKVQNGVITAVSAGYASIKLDVGGMARYVFVIVMPDYANTTYDSGTIIADNGYNTDSAGLVSFLFNNGSLDFQGRLTTTSHWAKTTFANGGWYWFINNIDVRFKNGNNTASVGNLDFTVIPVMAYDSATNTSFVVIYQLLTNTGNTKLTGQTMVAYADIMLDGNDGAPVMAKPYGARMYDPSSKLAYDVYVSGGDDCTPVDTFWFGSLGQVWDHRYDGTIRNTDISNVDESMTYGWLNIDIEPGETVLKSIRMTLVEYDPNNP